MANARLAIALACALVEGCSPYGGGAFHCATSDQCAGGTCEPEGFCSFPDPDCASGRRFGELGGSLAGVCVGDQSTTDGSMPDMSLDDSAIDTPMVDMTTAAPFCDAAGDPTLVGCWEFENNANDASGDMNNAAASGVTYTTGKVGMAVVQQGGSSLVIGDRASLEPQHITIEMWVRPAQTPPNSPGRWGLVDSDGAYGMFITNNTILCTFNGALTANVSLAANVWKHVACTTDGTTVRLYVDGLPTNPASTGGAPLTTGNTNGVVLGANSPNGDTFIGAIDQVRMFNEARTQMQICDATGLSTCK